jgi:hypothetical protein
MYKSIYTDIGPYAQFLYETTAWVKNDGGVSEVITDMTLEFGGIRGKPDIVFMACGERWLLDIKDTRDQQSFKDSAQINTYAAIANMTLYSGRNDCITVPKISRIGIYDVRAGMIFWNRINSDASADTMMEVKLPAEVKDSVTVALINDELSHITIEPDQRMSVKRAIDAAMAPDMLERKRSLLRLRKTDNIDAFFEAYKFRPKPPKCQ